jgi:hypothetical protein
MGTQTAAAAMAPGGGRWRALVLPLFVAVAGLLLAAAPSRADFHLMSIREVYPGAANDSYVMLQMYSPGQTNLNGHQIAVYGSTGSPITTFTFSGGVANGQSQRTVLVADDGYAAGFPSDPAPDRTHAALNVPAAGGAICFVSVDCVSWGNFSGSVNPPPGFPAMPGGVAPGSALRRSIAGGSCSNQLDAADDTNDSEEDFTAQTPHPRNNASPVEEGATCTPSTAPDTAIGNPKPASRTNSTLATFTFTASPSAEATFECRLDAEPAFSACTSPKEYTGLAGGAGTSHTFRVRATHPANGTDPTPASHTWTVDTVAPTATILTEPPDPSPGNSVKFTYSANEGGSSFQCSLVPLGDPDSFSSCPLTGKTYSGLTDGEYTFKVRAKDLAGNEGAPDSFSWEVDNSLNDEMAPQTTIVASPPNPSTSPNASFGYESNEAGSTFECKLDGGPLVSCDPTGVAYFGLANGPHSFQVRARDAIGNLDQTPAGYSWDVAVLAFEPPTLPPPPLPELASARIGPPPQTILTAKPAALTRDRTPTFRFRSSPAGSSFACKVDRGPFRPCSSPLTTKTLSFGPHTVQIRAVANGSVDPSPAKSSFRVAKRKRSQ